VVLSVEAIKQTSGHWLAFTDNGREHTSLDVVEWVQEAVERGAGEILLTSVDKEGGRKGYDLDLIHAVSNVVNVPIIASGGMGEAGDGLDAVSKGADAVAMADILHFKRSSVNEIRSTFLKAGIDVRPAESIKAS
jgi:cyclase